jgi:predicted Rossmann fold nucleotide-binding protein DprA/Smf involved in DNA uptake
VSEHGTVDVEEIRMARAALGWLVEPGNRELYGLVSEEGPVSALRRLVSGDLPATALRGAAQARLSTADPRRLAIGALIRARRLGARIVIPEDDEWPAQLLDLTRIELAEPGPMPTWIAALLMLTGSLVAALVKIRAHLMALYLWRKTGDLKVLREVARFERLTR